MNVLDIPAAIDDPVETLFGFHRRIERQLAVLCRLPVHLEIEGVDGASAASAASLLQFFTHALPLHHADEERDLLPMIERRATGPGERRDLADLRHRLECDHREMDATWRRLRRPLEALAEGVHRELPADLARYFRAVHSIHISAEESAVHLMAARWLEPSDRETLARRMLARRTVTKGSRR
jgi:hemerythrin-like domain-containing protein